MFDVSRGLRGFCGMEIFKWQKSGGKNVVQKEGIKSPRMTREGSFHLINIDLVHRIRAACESPGVI